MRVCEHVRVFYVCVCSYTREKMGSPSSKVFNERTKNLRHKRLSEVSSCSAHQLMKQLRMIFMEDEI